MSKVTVPSAHPEQRYAPRLGPYRIVRNCRAVTYNLSPGELRLTGDRTIFEMRLSF